MVKMRVLAAVVAALALWGVVVSGEEPGGVPEETQKTLLALLPEGGFWGALKQDGEGTFYDRSNLYEYIDGQAEGFIAYDFQALLSATYSSDADSLTVDVYDMGKPIQAFGLYSTFRSPSNDFVQLGEQGFKTGEGYMYWKGRYVVRTSGYSGDEGRMYKAALAASQATARKIAADRVGLEMLKLLPERGRIANSEKYIMQAVLGQGFLSNGVTAEYEADRGTARLFVCDTGREEGALKAYREYLKFATAHGTPVETEAGKAFAADVKYYGITEVFVVGRHIAGGVALPKEHGELIEGLKQSISAPSGNQKVEQR